MLKMLSGSGCSCCCHDKTGAAGFNCAVLMGGVGRTVDVITDLCNGCAQKQTNSNTDLYRVQQ